MNCKHGDIPEFNEPCASCDHCSNWEDPAPQWTDGREAGREWISVEDRMPEEPGEVLMVLYGRVCIAWYHIDGRFESGSGLVFSAGKAVTHWMPLPEPPVEEE